MTATAARPAPGPEATPAAAPDRAEGVELLGPVHGCGYRDGAALVRRADGQMVQLGALMYALLDSVDGRRDATALADAVSERLGRRLEPRHVARLAEKLGAQGLLAGTEHRAPARRNPLLALRWKVLVTNPKVTARLTAPFTFLFRGWLMWPFLACFAAVFWFVLFHKGVASATAQAFHRPGLLLLVFGLAVASAGFHELGHAAACRYGGATPGGMGMGIYLVWPAFYTDVTDAYRLPRRDRLRVDLAGLYFNAVVAVITMAVWLALRADALLLLVALQVLQMVKQLSPVIRADGYHILSDATGVPDLYAQMGPTLRSLIPGGRRPPSPLTGRARLLVTLWVLVIVPVLLSLALGAVLLLPKLATSAWDSGRHIAVALPHQVAHAQVVDGLASIVRLLALALPVLGSVLVAQKIVRTTARRAGDWSRGHAGRRVVLLVAGAGLIAGLAWAWWPAGQYQPVRANEGGTLANLGRLVAAPGQAVRPTAAVVPVRLAPGRHLAIAMIPVGGATRKHPALFVIRNGKGKPAVAIVSDSTPKLGRTASTSTTTSGGQPSVTTPPAAASPVPIQGAAFPFKLPAKPGPGDSQALAVNTKNGSVTYDVAYSLVTVRDGAPVTNTNSAFALAHCRACAAVAVSFQIVLIVGESHLIAPINAAGAENYDCPACVTTAIADQMVVTLTSEPSTTLLRELYAALRRLNAISTLGPNVDPATVAADVAAVQQQVEDELNASGLLANPIGSSSSSGSTSSPTTTPTTPTTTPSSPTNTTPASPPVGTTPATTTPAAPPVSTTPATTTPATPPPPASTTPATTAPASTVPAPTSTTPTP